jgi:hypothetical protein
MSASRISCSSLSFLSNNPSLSSSLSFIPSILLAHPCACHRVVLRPGYNGAGVYDEGPVSVTYDDAKVLNHLLLFCAGAAVVFSVVLPRECAVCAHWSSTAWRDSLFA